MTPWTLCPFSPQFVLRISFSWWWPNLPGSKFSFERSGQCSPSRKHAHRKPKPTPFDFCHKQINTIFSQHQTRCLLGINWQLLVELFSSQAFVFSRKALTPFFSNRLPEVRTKVPKLHCRKWDILVKYRSYDQAVILELFQECYLWPFQRGIAPWNQLKSVAKPSLQQSWVAMSKVGPQDGWHQVYIWELTREWYMAGAQLETLVLSACCR